MNIGKGTVYWLTGLSGAGKTTIGRILYQYFKQKKENVIFLDGDALREVFGNDLGYSREDRMKSAMRNARLCRMLADQGMDVVCCTISMFDDVRQWNRTNIHQYKEIYLQVDLTVLTARNQKGLYSGKGQEHVVGVSQQFEEPKEPDLIVHNNGQQTPEEIAEYIMKTFI